MSHAFQEKWQASWHSASMWLPGKEVAHPMAERHVLDEILRPWDLKHIYGVLRNYFRIWQQEHKASGVDDYKETESLNTGSAMWTCELTVAGAAHGYDIAITSAKAKHGWGRGSWDPTHISGVTDVYYSGERESQYKWGMWAWRGSPCSRTWQQPIHIEATLNEL